MDKNLSLAQRERRIVATLVELGIGRCAGARLSALAKGEKKRVSLAVQVSFIYFSSF
jgi:energy-coupling factor transporter ATP-binding protein EcfA2